MTTWYASFRDPWLGCKKTRWLIVWGGLLCWAAAGQAHPADDLISSQAAARYGLERAWFAYARVEPSRHRVVQWVLAGDHVFALTSDGTVQSFDSETGQTSWVTEIASPADTPVGLAANSEVVAVVTATRLYLLQRQDGRQLWSRPLSGAPSAAPALSAGYAYVSLLAGRLEGFDLANPQRPVWHYQTSGHSYHRPLATRQIVSWSNDEGYLFVGSAEEPRPLWRIHTQDEVVAASAAQEPHLYAASWDGYLYCYDQLSGREVWRYSVGLPITKQPAIVAGRAYVASLSPALHAIDLGTGRPVWAVDGLCQFVAQGKSALYGLDSRGTLTLLDRQTGGILGRLTSSPRVTAIVNGQTDRIFLVNQQGLVQCWREMGATEPVRYRQSSESPQPSAAPAPAAAVEAAAPASSVEEAADEIPEDNPFENPFFE